ncbi:hypothetical protein GCM10007285_36060 [Stappia taiwanensis]|nr:AprI/Inh family metalloprotease inhibitor [Stappia taiwanensis]GGF04981.1 hypothetical protein GCM10007285_36060 [Stappia taiwanensis]
MGKQFNQIGVLVSWALFALLFFGTGITGAEPLARTVSGNWQLVDEVSGANCTLVLGARPAAAGPAGVFSARADDCRVLFSGAAAVAGWTAMREGGLALVDDTGAMLAAFDVGESEGLVSVEPSGVFLTLIPETTVAVSALIPTVR